MLLRSQTNNNSKIMLIYYRISVILPVKRYTMSPINYEHIVSLLFLVDIRQNIIIINLLLNFIVYFFVSNRNTDNIDFKEYEYIYIVPN